MNRFASLATATLTTALAGASIAAVSASQGLFSFGGDGAADTGTVAADQWAADVSDDAADPAAAWTATADGQATPGVVYVDKEPLIVTEEVVIPVPLAQSAPVDVLATSAGAPSSQPTTAPGNPASPTATSAPANEPDPAPQPPVNNSEPPAQALSPAPAPVFGPSGGSGASGPSFASGKASPTPTQSASTPLPASTPVPAAAPATDTSSGESWSDDEHDDDQYEDHEDGHEDHEDESDDHEDWD